MKYARPHDLADAVAQVAAGAVPLAGGSVIVPGLTRGAPEPEQLVDVGRLEPLRKLEVGDDELVIGAAVTLEQLERGEWAGEAVLAEAAAGIGNPLVRRLGTVGGNVVSGLPQADLVPALLVLDADAVWLGPDGEERERVADALGRTHAGRLLTEIRVRRDPNRRSGFAKFAWRRSTGTSVASVALAARHDDGSIGELRLAAGGFVAPARLGEAEALLAGKPWTEASAKEAGPAAAAEAARRAGLDPGELRPRLVALGVRRLVARPGPA